MSRCCMTLTGRAIDRQSGARGFPGVGSIVRRERPGSRNREGKGGWTPGPCIFRAPLCTKLDPAALFPHVCFLFSATSRAAWPPYTRRCPKAATAQTLVDQPRWPPSCLRMARLGRSSGSNSGITDIRLVFLPCVGIFPSPVCMASPGNPWLSGSSNISAPIPSCLPRTPRLRASRPHSSPAASRPPPPQMILSPKETAGLPSLSSRKRRQETAGESAPNFSCRASASPQ